MTAGIQPARGVIWALHLALPLAGLWLLLARPGIDILYLHAYFHFWLVLIVAAVNVALGVTMSAAAKQRDDGRLFLVSLVFLASAGFLLAHAAMRQEFGLLAEVAAKPLDPAHAALAEDQVALVLEVLHHHHTAEDDTIWPMLRERDMAEEQIRQLLVDNPRRYFE